MSWSGGRAAVALILSLLVDVCWAGNTTCTSGQLDWYSSVVGESPCTTYQRLRQICNIDYQVPSFSQTPPGDTCNDQVSDCCCNTVAFQLSMLCLNCQADASTGAVTGVDAAPGTFDKYLSRCSSPQIDVLPTAIQQAVCNLNIRLDDFLYSHWDDGSWYYVWSKENAGKEHAAYNNNTFTHCASQVSSLASLPTVAAPSDSSTQSNVDSTATAVGAALKNGNVPNSGTIAGIVVSVLAIVVIACVALWLVRRRRRINQMRASRPYRWTAAHSRIASESPFTREYATASRAPTLDIYATDRPRLVFSPEAMIRDSIPAPAYEVIRGRTSAIDPYSQDDDSRVYEPVDDAPDPELPLVPLRLQTTEGKY